VDGICAACIAYAARSQIDWDARREDLKALVSRAKSVARARGNHYDVIVPSSGGKDSHYQVLELIAFGARPLVVTASTCHLTNMGRVNIDNLARYASTIEVTPNRYVRTKLNKLGLELVGDISWPEHVSIFTTPIRVARAAGIPFIFYGENPQNQYGGPLEAQGADQMTERWRSEFGGFLGLRPKDLIGMDGLTEDDLADYVLPDGAWLGLEAHFLGHYVAWDSHRNAERAAEAGMVQQRPSPANWWDHENLDNAQTGLHDYVMYLKYGYGRGCAQISVDVRAGRITRDKALRWVEENDGTFPSVYAGVSLQDVLEHIGLRREKLERTLEAWRARAP